MNPFSIDVSTRELIKLLKTLCKLDRTTDAVWLTLHAGMLKVSLGKTSVDIPATGSWPDAVTVNRKWAEALTTSPVTGAVTPLRVSKGRLWTRDFGVACTVGRQVGQGQNR